MSNIYQTFTDLDGFLCLFCNEVRKTEIFGKIYNSTVSVHIVRILWDLLTCHNIETIYSANSVSQNRNNQIIPDYDKIDVLSIPDEIQELVPDLQPT